MTSEDSPFRGGVEWETDIRVSILQTEIHLGDVDRNLDSAYRLIDMAARDETDLCVMPEVFATGFPYDDLPDLVRRSSEVMDGISEKARDHSMNVIFTQVIEEGGRFRNRLFHVTRDGEIGSTYDKTHLFTRSGEDRFFTPGSRLKMIRLEGIEVGPLICYEVRFPELSRRLVTGGAKILAYPAQWPEFRTFQWDTLLKARAIENQCYVIGVNGYGRHGEIMMGGMSSIYSPYGELKARVGSEEGHDFADLSTAVIGKIRKNIPCLEEIRDDIEGP